MCLVFSLRILKWHISRSHLLWYCRLCVVYVVSPESLIHLLFVCGFCQMLCLYTVLVLIKLTKFAVALRLRCGCIAVPVNLFFDIILSFFAKFKNVAHRMEPGETLSNSASHQAPNYVQRS